MMRIMRSERGKRLFATDAYTNGMSSPLEESTFTQRFRIDEVLAIWREKKESSNGLMEKSNLLTLSICMKLDLYLFALTRSGGLNPTGQASAHEIWRASISTH
ncbi:hypothetical protein CsSME_00034512 [Camellia sinensis var. sinensis]